MRRVRRFMSRMLVRPRQVVERRHGGAAGAQEGCNAIHAAAELRGGGLRVPVHERVEARGHQQPHLVPTGAERPRSRGLRFHGLGHPASLAGGRLPQDEGDRGGVPGLRGNDGPANQPGQGRGQGEGVRQAVRPAVDGGTSRPARSTADGALVLLAEQDRSLWDRAFIAGGWGVALITDAMRQGAVGDYQVQAAIAAVHDQAPLYEETNWPEIAALYSLLEQMTDNLSAILAKSRCHLRTQVPMARRPGADPPRD